MSGPYQIHRERALEMKREKREAIEAVESNLDLTPDAKRRQIGEITRSFEEAIKKARADHQEGKADYVAGKHRSVFHLRHSLGTSPTDKHAASTRYLSTLDLVSHYKTQRELNTTLLRAESVGDEILRQAVIHRAHELGFTDLVRRAIPDESTRADYEEILAIEGASATQKMAERMDFSA